jgi:multisubunit Na+/H+ antiporter MnhB subunit
MPEASFNPYEPPEAEISHPVDSGLSGAAWLTILVRPRATIRRIIDSGRTSAVIPLAVCFGISTTFAGAFERYHEKGVPTSRTLVEIFFGGPLLGVASLFFLGFLIRLTGRWIGGQGSQKDLRTAMAWASVPFVPTLIYHCLAFAVFDVASRGRDGPNGLSRPQAIVLLGLGLVQLIGLGWSSFLWVKCVAEAHRFSWVKALAAGFLGYLTCIGVAVGVAGVAFVIGYFQS